jgi:hypothetical protein
MEPRVLQHNIIIDSFLSFIDSPIKSFDDFRRFILVVCELMLLKKNLPTTFEYWPAGQPRQVADASAPAVNENVPVPQGRQVEEPTEGW